MDHYEPSANWRPSPPDPVELYQDGHCRIVDRHDSADRHHRIVLTLLGKWHPKCATIGREYGVDKLVASAYDGWTENSIDFLEELPALRSVFIHPAHTLDWRPLECLLEVDSVGLWPDSDICGRAARGEGEIDFTRLSKMQKCSMLWIPQWDSIRHCGWIKRLNIHTSWAVRELDLRELVQLEELSLESCGRLRKIELAEEARIHELKLSQCRKLQLDLKRFVRDLEYLRLEGKQAYPLDDLGEAKHLKKFFFTFLNNKVPIPPFMGKLPNLIDAIEAGALLSESDKKIMDRFNERRKRKREAEKNSGANGDAAHMVEKLERGQDRV